MNSAYDSYDKYRFAIEDIGTAPIIALNPRGRGDAITSSPLYFFWMVAIPVLADLRWFTGPKKKSMVVSSSAALRLSASVNISFVPLAPSQFMGRPFTFTQSEIIA